MAAVFCAQQLGVPITVVVPESTPDLMVRKLKEEGAVVEVTGKVRLYYYSALKPSGRILNVVALSLTLGYVFRHSLK